MNNKELLALQNLMQGAYDRSSITSSPKNFFSVAAGEFAKELATNVLFEKIRLTIADLGKEALSTLKQAKMTVLKELEDIIILLSTYITIIPALSYIIEEHDNIKKDALKIVMKLLTKHPTE